MSDHPPDVSNAPPLPHRAPGDLLRRMGRLVRKEVSTILRDRRTIITLVLMPLLLYPLLTIAFRQFLLASSIKEMKEPDYRLGFRNPLKQLSPGEKAFVAQLSAGEELIARREQRPARTDSPTRPPRPESPFRSGDSRQTTPEAKPRHTPGFQLASASPVLMESLAIPFRD